MPFSARLIPANALAMAISRQAIRPSASNRAERRSASAGMSCRIANGAPIAPLRRIIMQPSEPTSYLTTQVSQNIAGSVLTSAPRPRTGRGDHHAGPSPPDQRSAGSGCQHPPLCCEIGQEPHLGLNVLLTEGVRMVGSRWRRTLHFLEQAGAAACPGEHEGRAADHDNRAR
jgi:hypothetical protein